MRCEQGAERVLGHVRSWRAKVEAQAAAENARVDPRAGFRIDDVDELCVARFVRAERPDARAVLPGGSRQPLELRRAAIEHGRTPRLEAKENLGLRVCDRLDRAEMLDVDGRDR